MTETSRFKQLMLFGLLAVLSYGLYQRYFHVDASERFKPFTKGYALTGVVIKSTDDSGQVVTTVRSPTITHYADTEVTVIDQPNVTLHESQGDWVFTSSVGEINPNKTEIFFPNRVRIELASPTEQAVTVDTSALLVDVTRKTGTTDNPLVVTQLGSKLRGLGAVVNFNQQEIELLSEMYAEFEN
ncbi:LPS export ABC transporter periplasmic protein LptC [Marinicella meishanensis]|uniref:LPS export ABC transporter periplasmic protein LptC n=1 Tax=Marinicella meishanensis TaxID=2873263 RepID=UPI001CBE03DA|nr:LPS export ABC transporter periplasmic protein LptC [Marinicella sp. NBU2979]